MSKKYTTNDTSDAPVCMQFALKANSMRVLEVGLAIKTLSGYDAEDFISAKLNFADLMHPDDKDLADELFSLQTQSVPKTINFRFRHANGKIICLQGCYQKNNNSSPGEMQLQLHLRDAKALKQTISN